MKPRFQSAMESIRNVRLLPTYDLAYQQFLKSIIAKKRLKVRQPQKSAEGSFTIQVSVPKPQPCSQQLSRKAEWLVRKWLSESTEMHAHRILSYEQYNPNSQQYISYYREIDAIFQDTSTGRWLFAEVKLSRNPQAVSIAAQQLSQSLTVVQAAGWQISPLVVWLNLCPEMDSHSFPVTHFHPDFRSVKLSYSTPHSIPVISIAPTSLFQWGVYKGLASLIDLHPLIAARSTDQSTNATGYLGFK